MLVEIGRVLLLPSTGTRTVFITSHAHTSAVSFHTHTHTHAPAHTTLFHARTHMHTDSLVRTCTRSALHIQLQGTHTVDPFNGTNTNSCPNTRTQTHHVAPWVVSSKNIHHHVCSITRRHCGNKRGGGLDSMKSAERFDGSCLKCAWN